MDQESVPTWVLDLAQARRQLRPKSRVTSYAAYKFWQEGLASTRYGNAYKWLRKLGDSTRHRFYRLLDSYLPEWLRYENRGATRDFDQMIDFTLEVLRIIEEMDLTKTVPVYQRIAGEEIKLILVKPIVGAFDVDLAFSVPVTLKH